MGTLSGNGRPHTKYHRNFSRQSFTKRKSQVTLILGLSQEAGIAGIRAFYISAVLYFLFGLSITFLAVVVRSLLPDIEPQKALPGLLSHIMPVGLKGLSIAAFLVVATTLQRDIHAHFRPKITNRERIFVNRFIILILGLFAMLIALKSESVVSILLLGFSIYVPGLLLPVLAASYHSRAPSRAMLATIVAGAGGAAVWSIIKEPVMPAVIAGLIMAAIPFSLGFSKRENWV